MLSEIQENGEPSLQPEKCLSNLLCFRRLFSMELLCQEFFKRPENEEDFALLHNLLSSPDTFQAARFVWFSLSCANSGHFCVHFLFCFLSFSISLSSVLCFLLPICVSLSLCVCVRACVCMCAHGNAKPRC